MIAKNTQLLTKEMEATNSSKLNVSYNLLMYINYIKLRSLYNKLYLYVQTSDKDEDSRSFHNSTTQNDSGIIGDNFHNTQNQHGDFRSSILTPTTIRFNIIF